MTGTRLVCLVNPPCFLILLFAVIGLCLCGPTIGPADIVMKFTEKCKWSLPTFIDADFLLYKRKSKIVLTYIADFPYGYTDEFGIALNVAIRGNGGWRPNFFKYKTGTGLCTWTKTANINLFGLMGKQLNQREPFRCPLPSGKINITIEPEMKVAQRELHLGIAPYGEFKIVSNITHKDDVVQCFIFYLDLVPKRNKKKG